MNDDVAESLYLVSILIIFICYILDFVVVGYITIKNIPIKDEYLDLQRKYPFWKREFVKLLVVVFLVYTFFGDHGSFKSIHEVFPLLYLSIVVNLTVKIGLFYLK